MSNIRDILSAFSPSSDHFALCSGDSRIKIWDTVNGQLQSEFSDILSKDDDTNILTKSVRGHLSVDYTCMKWVSLDKKKKRKLRTSLIVLGTGSGDVLALDVAAGHVKWIVNDCHPGGVTSISFSSMSSSVYSAGADGMICKIDCTTGNILEKFKASAKAISSLAVSPDGKLMVVASAHLKVFTCANHKKLLKFSGHPGSVRCVTFSDDGRYILSSSSVEKYVAVWDLNDGKKASASCILDLEHPAVLLDVKCNPQGIAEDAGLYVLAVSEIGVCYIWYGKNLEGLKSSKPTKVSISSEAISNKNKGAIPAVLAAKLDASAMPASRHVFVACGLHIKPSFQRTLVTHGLDVILNYSLNGVLLPSTQNKKSKKSLDSLKAVSALDRANAEEAIHPMPKMLEFVDRGTSHDQDLQGDYMSVFEAATVGKVSIEEQLRSLGALGNSEGTPDTNTQSTSFKNINLETPMPPKKIKTFVLTMGSEESYKFLRDLVDLWKSKKKSAHHFLTWINCVLVNHNQYIVSQEAATPILDSLCEITKSRGSVIESLLQLSGRLKLLTSQIDISVRNKSRPAVSDLETGENQVENESDDVEDALFNEEDESDISSNDDEMDDEW